MTLKEFKSQTTVSFSGYNILKNIKWAINSFLYFHPDMKNNIIVFDDDSDDGTKEWLEKVGIKRITWSERFLPYREKARKIREAVPEKSFSYHCSLIVSDIMHQVNTKYLLLNDGDIVFLKNVIDKYYKYFFEDVKGAFIILPYGNGIIEEGAHEHFGKEADKYKILLRTTNTKNAEIHRVHAYHGILDLEFFKSINLLFDDFDSLIVVKGLNFPGIPIDSGLDFYYHIEANKIPYKFLQSQFTTNDTDVFHFGLVSSHKKLRELDFDCVTDKDFLEAELNKYFHKVVNLKETMNDPRIIDHLG